MSPMQGRGSSLSLPDTPILKWAHFRISHVPCSMTHGLPIADSVLNATLGAAPSLHHLVWGNGHAARGTFVGEPLGCLHMPALSHAPSLQHDPGGGLGPIQLTTNGRTDGRLTEPVPTVCCSVLLDQKGMDDPRTLPPWAATPAPSAGSLTGSFWAGSPTGSVYHCKDLHACCSPLPQHFPMISLRNWLHFMPHFTGDGGQGSTATQVVVQDSQLHTPAEASLPWSP